MIGVSDTERFTVWAQSWWHYFSFKQNHQNVLLFQPNTICLYNYFEVRLLFILYFLCGRLEHCQNLQTFLKWRYVLSDLLSSDYKYALLIVIVDPLASKLGCKQLLCVQKKNYLRTCRLVIGLTIKLDVGKNVMFIRELSLCASS